jgi:hypothetical protein
VGNKLLTKAEFKHAIHVVVRNIQMQDEIYTQEEFEGQLKTVINNIQVLAKSKGAEYAHGGDRLDNFRRQATELGLPMEIIWRVYAGKHWDALTTYINDLKTATSRKRSEPITGRIDDLIVYLILFRCMYDERERGSDTGDMKFPR